jgi:DNA repair protein RadC
MVQAPFKKHFTTKDLPESLRPRERLAAVGAQRLSDSELIALVIGTGAKGVSSMSLAQEIFCRFERRLGRLAAADLPELSAVPGVGPAKAAQLLAAIELGQRSAVGKTPEKESLASPEQAARYVMPKMRHLEREHFAALIVNTKMRLIKYVEIAIGGLNSAIIHPRELYKPAVRANGAGLIAVHNHPSGDPDPSREDIILTRRLAEAGKLLGIDLIDHIIIGDDCWVSLKERGHIQS